MPGRFLKCEISTEAAAARVLDEEAPPHLQSLIVVFRRRSLGLTRNSRHSAWRPHSLIPGSPNIETCQRPAEMPRKIPASVRLYVDSTQDQGDRRGAHERESDPSQNAQNRRIYAFTHHSLIARE